jgi:hypothetical protein
VLSKPVVVYVGGVRRLGDPLRCGFGDQSDRRLGPGQRGLNLLERGDEPILVEYVAEFVGREVRPEQ